MSSALFGLVKVGILWAIAIGLIVYIFIKSGGEKMLKNWQQHRSNPMIMPFAGIFGKDSGKNTKGVIYSSFQKNFGVLMKPLQHVIDMVKKNLGGLTKSLNIFRALMTPIRDFIGSAMKMFFGKLSDLMSTIIYFFLKMRDLMRRLASTFRLTLYTLQAIKYTMTSVWDGPVGTVARDWGYTFDTINSFFCLEQNTQIRMADGSSKRVRDLVIGEPLDTPGGSSELLGMATILERNPTLYRVGDCLVSGSHLVYTEGGVKEASKVGTPTEMKGDYCLYCPITANHKLVTEGGTVLADFEECTEPELEREILQESLGKLNGREEVCDRVYSETPGVRLDTHITLADGSTRPIQELTYGDVLLSSTDTSNNKKLNLNKVLGLVEFQPTEKESYQFHNLVATSRQLLYEKGEWRAFGDIARVIEGKNRRYYSLLTTEGMYQVNGIWVTDVLDGQHIQDIHRYEKMLKSNTLTS